LYIQLLAAKKCRLALGADRVIDYKTEDYKEIAKNLDIVLTL
jgi:NADPH:quinone reductase-like Zn-dependent oxidoreductase